MTAENKKKRIHVMYILMNRVWIYEPNLDAAQYAAWSNQICYNCAER